MQIHTMQLQIVNEERDIGVIISEDLKWEMQCVDAIKRVVVY